MRLRQLQVRPREVELLLDGRLQVEPREVELLLVGRLLAEVLPKHVREGLIWHVR